MQMDSQTVFDFATTTGGFYQAHLRFARDYATDVEMWKAHITANVLPALKRELHLRSVVISTQELTTAARELMAYYREHLEDNARHDARKAAERDA